MNDFIVTSKYLMSDKFFHVVLVLCVFDIVLGTTRAIMDKEYHSAINRVGITNHVITMLTVVVMNWVLAVIGYKEFTKMFITFYIANYTLSIIETTGKMGVQYPKFLKAIFTELQESTNENKRPNNQ